MSSTTQVCPNCSSNKVTSETPEYSQRFSNVSKQAGLLGNTILLPLTALIAIPTSLAGKNYTCKKCKHEWYM